MNEDNIIVLKKVKNVTLIFAIAFAVLGILLLLIPFAIYDFLGYLLGGAAVAFGGYLLVLYFMRKRSASILAVDLFAGILLAAFGITCLGMHARVTGYTAVIFGLLLIAGSILKFQNAIDLFRIGMIRWWIVFILAAISVVFGILLLTRPLFLQDTDSFLLAAGIFLLYDSCSDFASVILFSIHWNKFGKRPEDDSSGTDASEPLNRFDAASDSKVDSMEASWNSMRENPDTVVAKENKDQSAEGDAAGSGRKDTDQKLSDADKDFKEMQ